MSVFKCLVLVVTLVTLFNPISCQDDIKDATVKMVKECQQSTGATDADIDALRNRKLPESKEGICMFECFFEHAKVMPDGKYSEAGLVAALTPMMGGDNTKVAKLKEMATACGKEIEAEAGDKCVVAQKLMHCTVEKGKEFGFEYPNNF